jgi:hypothetical protein
MEIASLRLSFAILVNSDVFFIKKVLSKEGDVCVGSMTGRFRAMRRLVWCLTRLYAVSETSKTILSIQTLFSTTKAGRRQWGLFFPTFGIIPYLWYH